jgi:hypothetical protein
MAVRFEVTPGEGGWRYGVGIMRRYRTRRASPGAAAGWMVERLSRREWKRVGVANTFADARELARTDDLRAWARSSS